MFRHMKDHMVDEDEMQSPPRLLRHKDLKERRIVPNRTTQQRWIEKEGFPRGFLLGPGYRVWTEEEITEWIEQRRAVSERRLKQPVIHALPEGLREAVDASAESPSRCAVEQHRLGRPRRLSVPPRR